MVGGREKGRERKENKRGFEKQERVDDIEEETERKGG